MCAMFFILQASHVSIYVFCIFHLTGSEQCQLLVQLDPNLWVRVLKLVIILHLILQHRHPVQQYRHPVQQHRQLILQLQLEVMLMW
jgi:uncharacterized protein YqhQ